MRASHWLPAASGRSTLHPVGVSEPLSLLEIMGRRRGCGGSDPVEGYEAASGFCVTDTLPTPTYTLTSPRVKTGPWRSASAR